MDLAGTTMRAFGTRSIGLWLLASSLALGVNAQPQRRPQAAEAFRVQLFTTDDGLPTNTVFKLVEDSLGFLWIGTGNGLVRYDGYTFESFLPRPGDSTSIGSRQIRAVHIDARGHIWAGGGPADPGGLSRFDQATQRFTRYRHDPDNPNSLLNDEVITIVSSPSEPGTLWVGSFHWFTGESGGLSRLDVATSTFTHYTTENGLADDRVHALLMDRDGTLWFLTRSGLNRYDPATDTFDVFSPNLYKAGWGTLYEDRAGVLWVSSDDAGLFRFDRKTETFTSYLPSPNDPSDPRNDVGAILEDRVGTLWVGTAGGLYMFDRKRERFTRLPNQPSDFPAQRLYEDRFGVLWAGTETSNRGLLKVERWFNPFTIYQHDPSDPKSLAADAVEGILEDRAGILWIGTEDYLNRVDRKAGTVTRYRHREWIFGGLRFYEDRSGMLWIGAGCYRDILNRMDPRYPGRFTHFRHDPDNPNGIGPGCINRILEDQSGNFWIALWSGGIDRMDRDTGTFTHYTTEDGLGHENVLWLYEAPSEPGILWVGTEGGLSRFDTQAERFTNYDVGRSVMMLEDRQGRFWVATGSIGLHLFDRTTGTIRETFTTREGLSNNVVWSVYEDDRGFLWLSTEHGLSMFDPETRAFRNYYAQDGLPGNVFDEPSKYQSTSSELFFGGPNGAVSFFPEDLVENPVPPGVVLTGLRIGGEPVEIGPDGPLEASMMVTEAVTLSHSQNNLTFEYVGLQFIDPLQSRYRYMLEGYDEEWVEAGEQRTARYTNLDPGDYVFRVTARNGYGSWNEEGASVLVTVLPPWWRTTWAYILYGLLFVAGVFAVDRVQRRRLLHRERERARIQAAEERAEALQEIDDLKTRFFFNVSHEFRTPLTLILGPLYDFLDGAYGHLSPKQREHLSIMQRNGARLLRLVNQLLDLSRLEAGSMTLHARRANVVPALRRTVAAFASRAERRHITLQFHTDDDVIDLYFEADKLEKIVTNLLSNAFKFTPEHGKIRVGVETGLGEAGAYVEIAVKDTGAGIPADQLPHIFDRFHQVDASLTREQEGTGIGLALAKELVALHGGTVRVESEAGFGTTFFVRLPQGRAHLTDAEVMDETPPALPGDGVEDLDVSLRAVDAVLEAESDAASSESPAAHVPVVLIVEDNADMRTYLRNHLSARYRIEEAADGEEGLARARAVAPALVITDVMMPRMDGYALCRALKTDARLNHLPVILLTAKASEESKLEGLEYGADAYLYKPFSMKELLVRVENLIAIRRQLRARFSDEVVITPGEVVVSSEEAAFLNRVREVVEQRMADSTFGVEALAEEVGLGRRQLQRRVQALTDLSPSGYIRMMRLERAAQLLAQQAGRVSEVAYAVGFGSAEHFSRVFREVYGVPPSAYPVKPDQGMMESDKDVTASDMRKSSSG